VKRQRRLARRHAVADREPVGKASARCHRERVLVVARPRAGRSTTQCRRRWRSAQSGRSAARVLRPRARQRSRLCSKCARTLPPSISDSLPAALETARRSSHRSTCVTRASGGGEAHCRNCVTRREPWKLPSAPSSKQGVEPIANNRIVPAVVCKARDKRKRVTFADAVAAHVEPVAAGCRPAWSRRRVARSPAQRTGRTSARSLAPRRKASVSTASAAHAAQSGSTSSFSVNNGEQQLAEHTSLAKLFFIVSCRGSA
jgi:hypothetical protein